MQEIIDIFISILMKCSRKQFLWILVDSNLWSRAEHYLPWEKRLKHRAMDEINLIIWQKHNTITYFSLLIEILCGFWLFKVSKWLSGICSKLLWFSRLFKGTIELFLFNCNLTDWSEYTPINSLLLKSYELYDMCLTKKHILQK